MSYSAARGTGQEHYKGPPPGGVARGEVGRDNHGFSDLCRILEQDLTQQRSNRDIGDIAQIITPANVDPIIDFGTGFYAALAGEKAPYYASVSPVDGQTIYTVMNPEARKPKPVVRYATATYYDDTNTRYRVFAIKNVSADPQRFRTAVNSVKRALGINADITNVKSREIKRRKAS